MFFEVVTIDGDIMPSFIFLCGLELNTEDYAKILYEGLRLAATWLFDIWLLFLGIVYTLSYREKVFHKTFF